MKNLCFIYIIYEDEIKKNEKYLKIKKKKSREIGIYLFFLNYLGYSGTKREIFLILGFIYIKISSNLKILDAMC